jgi:lactate 2-monooxygenase
LLQRAKKAGYTVLFVTLDTYILGWRPSDTDNGYNPFLRADNIRVELGFMNPVFQKHFHEKYGKSLEEDKSAAAAEWTKMTFGI